jgi:deazaflavin-dependent oxidoreductase (nitroreductase family)
MITRVGKAASLLIQAAALPPKVTRVGKAASLMFNTLTGVHTLAYRLSRGLVGSRVPGGPPMLLLDHVGAKSAKKRTTPLVYLEDGDNVVLVASKGGSPRHPSWFHNLRANPETTVQVGSRRIPVIAKVATKSQRSRLWPRVVGLYRGYELYQRRTSREIPLVILEPRS